MTNPIVSELETLLAPAAKQVFDKWVIPELKTLEDKIGVDAVKQVVEKITEVLETLADGALTTASTPPA